MKRIIHIINFIVLVFLLPIHFSGKIKTNKNQNHYQSKYNMYQLNWSKFFKVSRNDACELTRTNDLNFEGFEMKRRRRFNRNRNENLSKKNWGFGPVSYLFDYLDPVFREKVVIEFENLYEEMKSFPMKIDNYEDPFDYLTRINKVGNSPKMIQKLIKFKKNYNKKVYDSSLNAPQIYQGFINFKWPIDKEDPSELEYYITKYDLNFDGRLSPREMILASIHYRPNYLGSSIYKYTYKPIIDILNPIFTFLDCNEDDFLSAQEIWNNLPGLKRNTTNFDIFAYGNDQNIRTSAINDFILKNMNAREGFVNREEFYSGILLGFWDRQTENEAFLFDDCINMKNLRWKEERIDVSLQKYLKELEIRKLTRNNC